MSRYLRISRCTPVGVAAFGISVPASGAMPVSAMTSDFVTDAEFWSSCKARIRIILQRISGL